MRSEWPYWSVQIEVIPSQETSFGIACGRNSNWFPRNRFCQLSKIAPVMLFNLKLPVQAINGRCLKCGYQLPLQSGRRRIIHSLAYIILFSVGVSFAPSLLAQSGGKATLILKVTGLRSEKGQVEIAVFNSSEKWLGEQPIYSSTIDVDSQIVTWRINDAPYGDYRVAGFHDENSNGKMDKNVLGIPLEPYGFSHNVRVTFGPPQREEAKFTVKGSTAEVSIRVK